MRIEFEMVDRRGGEKVLSGVYGTHETTDSIVSITGVG